MLNPNQIREYRERWGLSLRDVAKYCDLSAQFIGQVETEKKNLNYDSYKLIMSGINKAHSAKRNEKLLKEKTKEESNNIDSEINEEK